jgi:hypothetical protein
LLQSRPFAANDFEIFFTMFCLTTSKNKEESEYPELVAFPMDQNSPHYTELMTSHSKSVVSPPIYWLHTAW